MVNFNIGVDMYWGIMITNYYFLKGIAAGIFFIISIGEVFKIEKLQKFTKIGLWITFATSFMLPLILISDLGQPLRFYRLFLYPEAYSPMSWGSWILLTYFMLGGFTTHFYLRKEFIDFFEKNKDNKFISLLFRIAALNRLNIDNNSLEFDKKALHVLFRLNLLIAFALEMYAGILLSVNVSRPLWNSPIIPLMFMTSALISGAGFLLITYSTFQYLGNRKNFDPEDSRILVDIMKYAIILEIAFLLMQVLYFLNSTNRAQFQYVFLFNNGFKTTQYLLIDFGIALILPLILLSIRRFNNVDIMRLLGAGFGILGAAIYKYNLILGGQELPRTSNIPVEIVNETNDIFAMISLYIAFFTALVIVFWYFPWHDIETEQLGDKVPKEEVLS